MYDRNHMKTLLGQEPAIVPPANNSTLVKPRELAIQALVGQATGQFHFRDLLTVRVGLDSDDPSDAPFGIEFLDFAVSRPSSMP